jgi:hypothetical protein
MLSDRRLTPAYGANVTTKTRDEMPKHPAANANRAGAGFPQIDSQVALTFSGIALTASDTEKRRRTIKVAREAFDTIVRLRGNAEPRN